MEITAKPTVRVMRSHDYCHFEITLSRDEEKSVEEINELRKTAAMLVDEAVRQYQVMKKTASDNLYTESERDRITKRLDRIREMSRDSLSVEDAALLKAAEDSEFMAALDDGVYRYDDDGEPIKVRVAEPVIGRHIPD